MMSPKKQNLSDGVILTTGRISQCLLPSPCAGFFALLRMTRGALDNFDIITVIQLSVQSSPHPFT